MKLVTAVAMLATAGCASAPRDSSPLGELLAFEGRNLLQLEEAESQRVLSLARKLVVYGPKDFRHGPIPWQPWYIWKLDPLYDGACALMVDVKLSLHFPGTDEVLVYLFDPSGARLSTALFNLGWRLEHVDAELTRREGSKAPVLCIQVAPNINGRFLTREWYSFVGTELSLIRLEGKEGRLESNFYSEENWTIGPELPDRSESAWIAALKSPDPVERLRSLVWLDGASQDEGPHRPLNPGRYYAQTVALSASPGIRQAIQALRDDPDPWIREAARR